MKIQDFIHLMRDTDVLCMVIVVCMSMNSQILFISLATSCQVITDIHKQVQDGSDYSTGCSVPDSAGTG